VISSVTAVADLLLSRTVACTPRYCDTCGRPVTRLTPAQCAQIGSDLLPECRRRRCSGRLLRATDTHPTTTAGDPS
jgi:hypothetical protein